MHARLDISWRGKQCVLAKGPKIIAKLHMSQVSSAILNLAPIVTNVGAQDNLSKIPMVLVICIIHSTTNLHDQL